MADVESWMSGLLSEKGGGTEGNDPKIPGTLGAGKISSCLAIVDRLEKIVSKPTLIQVLMY